ncbi:MAG: hypothetical protein PHE03_05980 [Bacteroidales bacterium]|nr:hypothetical protein [Bacteroidales bacterium]MDD3891837.1 hypothetical protein [Bacteroidales bacterium]
MNNRKVLLLTLALWSLSLVSFSQSLTTNSPYSRYGLGEIRTQGYANTKAMGGISQGIRQGTWINYLNPASYTSQDSMSFIFDFGVEGSTVNYRSGDQSNYNSTGNLQHIAMQFPITKWMGASAGIQPYSNVGYRIKYTEMDPYLLSSIGPIKYYHNGSGGITQFYLGTAVEPFKNFSVGVNMSYFFGAMDYKAETVFPEYTAYVGFEELKSVVVRDFAFSFGAQYTMFFGEDNDYKIIIGGTLDNESSLDARYIRFSSSSIDTISYEENPNSSIELPSNYAGGFTVSYRNKFMLGAEYSFQDWTKAKFLGANNLLSASQSIRVGMQYTPNVYDLRSYLKRVSYRAGFYHTNTFLELRENQIKDYGITFGVGLPLRRSRSSFNLSFELGRKGTLNNGLVQENYGIINFGFTFYDFWFLKQQIN